MSSRKIKNSKKAKISKKLLAEDQGVSEYFVLNRIQSYRCPFCKVVIVSPSPGFFEVTRLREAVIDHLQKCLRGELKETSVRPKISTKQKTYQDNSSVQSGLFGEESIKQIESTGKGGESMPWKKRESGGTWGGKDTDEGSKISGTLSRTETNANATDDNPLFDYILENAIIDGQKQKGEIRVWGSAILNRRLSKDDQGKQIRITFKGMVKAKRGKAKDYEVEVNE